MNWRSGVLLACVAALATNPIGLYAAPSIDPAAISHDIDARGAHAVIAALVLKKQWDRVVRHIDSGNDAWLAVAAKLASGSDAGSAEDLGMGLAGALPRNPAGVLRTVSLDDRSPLSLARVCGIPFIEQSPAETAAYRTRAVNAVTHVTNPALADLRARCLNRLKS